MSELQKLVISPVTSKIATREFEDYSFSKDAKIVASANHEEVVPQTQKTDLEKIVDLISTLQGVKTKFTFESESCIKMYKDVGVLLDRVVVHIEK